MNVNQVRCPTCAYIFPSPIQGSGTITVGSGASIKAPCPSCRNPVDISRNQV